jgi:hypothetical protein
MKKTRNGFVKNLHYLSLVGIIALGLMTIVATGGGGGGGGGSAADGTVDVSGYWKLYHTTEGEAGEEGPDYLTCSQSGNDITVTDSCDPDEDPWYGTISGTSISISWTEDVYTVSLIGTVSGNTMSGTWSDTDSDSGTWRAEKTSEPDCFLFELLEFPFKTPADINGMAAFGIPNWSGTEPHNGIDLIIDDNLSSSRIVSPTHGIIKSINISENPFSNPVNQLLLTIEIYINSTYSVCLVIEPGTNDEQIIDNQINAVHVTIDQEVKPGDDIADLLVGDLGYPHLHYMVMKNEEAICAYQYSSLTAKQIFEDIADTRINNNLPDGNICYGQGN